MSTSPRRFARAAVIAAACLAPMAGTALVPAARAATTGPGALNLVRVWSRTYPGVTFRESSPVPAALSTPAVVMGALDGKVYAVDATNGSDEPGWPVQTTNPVNSSPAAADVMGDGLSRVFVVSGEAAKTVAGACSGGGTYAFEPSGAVRWHNIGSDPNCANQAFHSSFAIGDTTGSGMPDANIGALGLQSPSYNAISGVMNAGWPFYTDDTVFSSPALADVNGDGVNDIVIGGDSTPGGPINFRGGMMRAIDGHGRLLWEFNVDEQVRSSPAIGDIDGSGHPSIVFGTGNFWLQNGGANDSTSLFALDTGGHLRWRHDLGGVTMAAPALADINGSGRPAVIEGTFGSPGNPNGGLIWALDGNGNALPGWGGRASDGGVVIGGISTADLNGDGAQDLLVPTGAGVFIYDGRSAQQIGGINIGQVSYQNTPLVTDDGGGQVGITVSGTRPDGTGVVEHYRVGGGATLGSIGWPMFHHDAARTGNLATPPPPCTATAAAQAPTGAVTRLAGADRDATSVAVSQARFPQAGSAKAAVVASDANYPDALAGTPLAVARTAPLLLTPPGGLSSTVSAEITRAVPKGATVYLLGGQAALASSLETQVAAMGYVPQRISGSNRFGTAVAVAGALGDPATVLEATGFGFPDALSAGAAAANSTGAVLLTNGPAQASETASYLSAHPQDRVTTVGGPAAAADPKGTPVVGPDRYATAVMVAQSFFKSPATFGAASGVAFPDALSGGAAGGPMVLVPRCGPLPSSVSGYLGSIKATISHGFLFGGAHAVGDDVLSELEQVA